MALRSGYYGLKKKLLDKVKALPGIKSIGDGLSLNPTTGELTATGTTVPVEANPEGAATASLVKLGIGEEIYAVPDAAKTYQTDDATEAAIVDADYIPFLDSSAASGSGAPRKSTWSNVKSKLKAVFDALYMTWEANGVLGAKNLFHLAIPYPSDIIDNVTYNVNNDGTVTLNGTATSNNNYFFTRSANGANASYNISDYSSIIKNGNIFSAQIPSTAPLDMLLVYRTNEDVFISEQRFQDSIVIEIPSNASKFQIKTETRAGAYDNIIIKPMICVAKDTDFTYQPYAMTNRELTDIFTRKSGIATVESDFAEKVTIGNINMVELIGGNVNVYIRFTVDTAFTGSSIVFRTPQKPLIPYTHIQLYNRNSPYELINTQTPYLTANGNIVFPIGLSTGDYDLAGTFLAV